MTTKRFVPGEAERELLLRAADKIERGEPLTIGGDYIEGRTVVDVLRAIAQGGSATNVLRNRFSKEPAFAVIARTAAETRRHGTQAAAFRAMDKKDSKTGRAKGAAAKALQRARIRDREMWREKYFKGTWGDDLLLTDADIAKAIADDPLLRDAEPYLRRRQAAGLKAFLSFTGWREVPPRP